MGEYFVDLAIIAVLVIGITALNGVITNGIGTRFFGGKSRNRNVERSTSIQAGWKHIGGERK